MFLLAVGVWDGDVVPVDPLDPATREQLAELVQHVRTPS